MQRNPQVLAAAAGRSVAGQKIAKKMESGPFKSGLLDTSFDIIKVERRAVRQMGFHQHEIKRRKKEVPDACEYQLDPFDFRDCLRGGAVPLGVRLAAGNRENRAPETQAANFQKAESCTACETAAGSV